MIALVVGGIIYVGADLASTESALSGPVYVYGDSNTILASQFFKPGATVRARGLASPCTFFAQMKTDATTHPSVVVLSFTGATHDQCDRGSSRYDTYVRDYKLARLVFPPETKVYAILPPPTRSPAQRFLA